MNKLFGCIFVFLVLMGFGCFVGGQSAPLPTPRVLAMPNAISSSSSLVYMTRILEDINGDGVNDFSVTTTTPLAVSMYSGSDFSQITQYTPLTALASAPSLPNPPVFNYGNFVGSHDGDGDGISELIYVTREVGSGGMISDIFKFQDVDGDGIEELILLSNSNSGWQVDAIKLLGTSLYGLVDSSGFPPSGQTLSLTATPLAGGLQTIRISGATPNTLGLVGLSYGSANVPFGNGNHLWIDPNQMIPGADPYVFNFDSNGQIDFTVPVDWVGGSATIYLQAFNLPTGNSVYNSNGMQIGLV